MNSYYLIILLSNSYSNYHNFHYITSSNSSLVRFRGKNGEAKTTHLPATIA
jgi:hypothetical protein